MATPRTSRLHLSSLAAAVIAAVVSMSGCKPKQTSTLHDCACVCFKDTGKQVFLLQQTVSTSDDCGNVNGSACSGDSGGQHIDGQFANCGPNPNVARAFVDAIRSHIGDKTAGESGAGGQAGGAGTGRATGSGQ